ncbi:hypothetical protein FAZ95_28000 [Trinickia violacea]|uniref:Uncharacterized protein n=1 Tax=Trinickia violacea TaxID=2571746 RepID=A0A4P8IWQ2_9BURK|nr:hypothetical protein [Trinickia violacea]QCP52951.1 hypothetical protein FAZ95_28000 [Trinickia violacea]
MTAIVAILPELIRLHEVVHRCAYPPDDLDDAVYQRRLDDVSDQAIKLSIASHSRRPLMPIGMARKLDALNSRLAMIATSSGHEPAALAGAGSDPDLPAWPVGGRLLVTRAHLIALEQEVRALVGEIAESGPFVGMSSVCHGRQNSNE